jgi:hypothetical protein
MFDFFNFHKHQIRAQFISLPATATKEQCGLMHYANYTLINLHWSANTHSLCGLKSSSTASITYKNTLIVLIVCASATLRMRCSLLFIFIIPQETLTAATEKENELMFAEVN